MEDGNKDEIEGGLINFDKRYMVAKIIRELQSKCVPVPVLVRVLVVFVLVRMLTCMHTSTAT